MLVGGGEGFQISNTQTNYLSDPPFKKRLSGTDKQVNEEAVSFILRNLSYEYKCPKTGCSVWLEICLLRYLPASGNIIKYQTSSFIKLNNLAQNNNWYGEVNKPQKWSMQFDC